MVGGGGGGGGGEGVQWYVVCRGSCQGQPPFSLLWRSLGMAEWRI